MFCIMKFTEGVKYFFSSYTIDCTISLFYSYKEFVTKHGKGNCEEACHQGTVEGNWKSGVDPKPAVVKYIYFQRKEMFRKIVVYFKQTRPFTNFPRLVDVSC